MMETNPVSVAGSAGTGTPTRRRGPFEVLSLWIKKDYPPTYVDPSYDISPNNIQVKEGMALLTNLRDSTMRIGDGQLEMDSNSRAGGWVSISHRETTESIPDGFVQKFFVREPFHYSLTESDQYHKPWDGISVGLICEANWVTVTTVTTFVPGNDPVIVTTETSTPMNIQFSRAFIADDWVYDPLAPSQTYYKEGLAYYNPTTELWELTNPDLVSGEFQFYERTYTLVYDDPYTGAYVETNIVSNLVPSNSNPYYTTQPWVLEYCENPGFWTG
jgi:hypothetical protein